MQDSRLASANAFRRALVPLALAVCFALSGCNTGSMTDGLASTAAVNKQVPPPPSASAGETALAAQTATSSAPEAAIAQQTATGGTAPAPQQGATKSASLGGSVPPVAFLPVTGAPQSAVTNLANSMRLAAKSESVPVVVSIEQGARYQVKGYFSALNDGTGTILVYVWDVLDANGTRVHRISGQERGGGTSGDPWAAITPDILSRVAGITMSGLKTWISTRGAG